MAAYVSSRSGAQGLENLYTTHIKLGSDDHASLKVDGYRVSPIFLVLAWVLIVLTGGFGGLLVLWRPQWWIWFTHHKCPIPHASSVVIMDENEELFVRKLQTVSVSEHGGKSWLTKAEDNTLLDGSAANTTLQAFAFPGEGGVITYLPKFMYFTLRKVLYVWIPELETFEPPHSLDHRIPCAYYHTCEALSTSDVLQRRAVFHVNQILVKLKPIWLLLFQEVLTPFYIFQIFSVCLWIQEGYENYALVLLVTSAVSVAVAVYQIRSNTVALRDTLHTSTSVLVERDGHEILISSLALVPGDVFILSSQTTLQCDAVLLSGTCIVNESMLTGESVPETKTPIPHESVYYHPKTHAKHTLFNGTRIMLTRSSGDEKCRAVAIRTGFNTVKGQLVRSIMYPKPVESHFTTDLTMIIGLMSVFAGIGFVYSVVIMVQRKLGSANMVVKAFDVVTIAVPPALPVALTIGIMLARQRLKAMRIFCISPNVINTCGGISAVVFDKTGTLTEEGLSYYCALPVDARTNNFTVEVKYQEDLAATSLVEAMATCHSLTYIDGMVSGDPIDQILFQMSGWELYDEKVGSTIVREPNSNRPDLAIVRQFPFASSLQRMAVIVKRADSSDPNVCSIYLKGAPETVVKLCGKGSLPCDFDSVLHGYTKRGYRVLAYAHRTMQIAPENVKRIPRHEVECDMTFIGLVITENRLKPETEPVIRSLLASNIRCVMCTGDNIRTAIYVGRQCGILATRTSLCTIETKAGVGDLPSLDFRFEDADTDITNNVLTIDKQTYDYPHLEDAMESFAGMEYSTCAFAMTGETFAYLDKNHAELLSKLVCRVAIFARMLPDQKTQLVHLLQKCQYIVAMCGDGANDCGALKAANAGISLSEAEASIASPFTSQVATIECVQTVIREGRAALVTSLGIAKFMVMYSMIQFLNVCLLYSIATDLGEYQFLYEDLFLGLLLSMTFGFTPAADQLSPRAPAARILNATTVASLCSHVGLVFAFQVFIFWFVTLQPWFIPFTDPGDKPLSDASACTQDTCIFLLAALQILSLAVVFSKSRPHRKGLITNYVFCAALLSTLALTVWLTIEPSPYSMADFFGIKPINDYKFKVFILLLGFLYFNVALVVEDTLVEKLVTLVCVPRQPKCKQIEREMINDSSWMSQFTTSNSNKTNGVSYFNEALEITEL